MRCITLWQPWATLLVLGVKTRETRSWRFADDVINTRIGIHAALRPFNPAKDVDAATWQEMKRALDRAGVQLEEIQGRGRLLGAIVGSVVPTGCERVDVAHEYARMPPDRFGDYSVGRWVTHCAHPHQLVTPVPFKGAQGWFNAPERLVIPEGAIA